MGRIPGSSVFWGADVILFKIFLNLSLTTPVQGNYKESPQKTLEPELLNRESLCPHNPRYFGYTRKI